MRETAGVVTNPEAVIKSAQAIGAALAVGLSALATGLAQSRIGSAACGALVERPEVSGTVFILVALPETMVVLGFVIAAIIIFAM